MRYLKSIRVVTSIIFIVLTTILFLDFTNLLSGKWDNAILSFQFVPSLLKLFRGVSYVAIGFIGFTLLSFVFGRWYCSFVCPLGILQDIFIRINKFVFRKKRIKYSYHNSVPWLKHFVFVITLLFMLFGSTAMFILLDPFSNYGRIATHILQPIYLFFNNVIALVVNKMGYYGIYHIEIQAFDFASFIFALFIVFLLLLFTHKRGRLFCNTLCPVGAFLGKTSTISLFKLKISKNRCISCGLCELECKAESIDSKNQTIDFNRCVSCFNCIDVCSESAITYQLIKKGDIQKVDKSRRNTLKTLFAGVVGVSGLSFTINKEQFSSFKSKTPTISKYPVIPPGAISLEHYKSTCIACHLCVSSCPSKVIQSTFAEFGFDGLLIPKMDYGVNYCQFECNLCGEVCPTGAIKPLKIDNKKVTQIGKVTFVKDNCVVSQIEQDCGACAEHCPTKAVKMVPYNGKNNKKLLIPEVNTSLCIGCGACEYACPVRPYKAIYVESNINHLIAQKPTIEKLEQKGNKEQDFPF